MLQFPNGLREKTVPVGADDPFTAGQIAEALEPAETVDVRWYAPALMAADIVVLAAGVRVASVAMINPVAEHLWSGAVIVVCWLVALAFSGMYEVRMRGPVMRIFDSARALFLGGVVAIAITFFINPGWMASRGWYLLLFACAALSCGLVRVIVSALVPRAASKRRVAVFGTVAQAAQIIELLRNGRSDEPRFFTVAAVLDTPEEVAHDGITPADEDFATCLEKSGVDLLVIPAGHAYSEDVTRRLGECDAAGIQVMRFEHAYERLTQKAPVFNVGADWIAGLESVHRNRYSQRPKRILDIVVTLSLMPIALPLIGICAGLIKILSPGPVFYTQTRVGKDGRPFNFAKLRTMIPDAEKHTGPVWAKEDDPRVTPIGRLLRKTRLDELPQLFHVLTGQMSLIGPRPERPKFVEELKDEVPLYEHRLMVRPGITGWAQIHHNYDRTTADVVEKLRYDLYYIRNLCFNLDCQIIVRTIGVMLGKKGAH
jgi:exopolysaccharide biosynthesis polyprenyl glycosylphosphotransferase